MMLNGNGWRGRDGGLVKGDMPVYEPTGKAISRIWKQVLEDVEASSVYTNNNVQIYRFLEARWKRKRRKRSH